MLNYRGLLFLAACLLFTGASLGQTTTVNGSVTDTAGQAWAAGTYTFTFVPSPPNYTGQNFQDGVPFTPTPISGSLDNTGAFSGVAVPSNDHITPSGSRYNLKVCPMANSQCIIAAVFISGGTQSVVVNPIPVVVNGSVLNQTLAYNDTEISGPIEGFLYYNYTGAKGRVFHNGAFVDFGGGGGGGGTLSSVGLTVQPGGALSVTNSPLIADGNLGFVVTGNQGGVLWFDQTNRVQSTPTLTQDCLLKGNNTNAPGCASPTDNGSDPTRVPNGLNFALSYIAREGANSGTGTQVYRAVCRSGAQVQVCGSNPASGVIGVAEVGAGNTGTVTFCVGGRCQALFDNPAVVGDFAVVTTTGHFHDTGSALPPTAQQAFYIDVANAGSETNGYILPPGDLVGGGGGGGTGFVSPMTTACDMIVGGAAGVATRFPCNSTPTGVVNLLGTLNGTQQYILNGLGAFAVAGTTDTVLDTYRGARTVYTGSASVAVALPTPATLHNQGYTNKLVNATTGVNTLVTVTAAGGATIANGSTTPAGTFAIAKGQACTFSMAAVATNWTVDCYKSTALSDLRMCSYRVGADNGVILVDTDLGPQGDTCTIPYAADAIEIGLKSDGGTPNVIVGRERAGAIVNMTSAVLAAAGATYTCSNVGGTVSKIDGTTTCSATLQNNSLNGGDSMVLVSGTAGGVAKRLTIKLFFR